MLNRREYTSQQLKQESYHRLSYAIATVHGKYKDRNSRINMVSIIHSLALTLILKN